MTKRKNNKKAAGEAVEAPEKKKGAETQTKKAPVKKPQDKGPGFLTKTRQFFREVRIELRKVTWPSRKETIASTSVVIVLVVIVSIYLGAVDLVLSRALKMLLE